MPQREQEICSRLIEFRTARGLKRSDVARAMGVNQATLANIEKGRSPLKFSMGYNLCQTYNICLRWLATGRFPKTPFTPILQRILERAGAAALFSDGYDRELVRIVEIRLAQIADSCKTTIPGLDGLEFWDFHPSGGSAEEGNLDQVMSLLRGEFRKMDGERQKILVSRLIEIPNSVWKDLSVEYKRILTDAETSPRVAEVKSQKPKLQLPELLERLKKATAETGRKSELAAFLKEATEANVPLASVSRWLSGERKPGGEVALQMDAWATAKGYPRAK